MEIQTIILWSLAVIVAPVVLFLVIRFVLKEKPYEFKMIFRSPGVDSLVTKYGESLDLKVTVNGNEYEIKPERLYRLKPGFIRKRWNKFRGIKQSFVTVYQYGKTEPMAPFPFKVSARILKEVSESRALDKALKSEFNVPWDLKKIMMVIGFLVIAVVIWVVISGDVAI